MLKNEVVQTMSLNIKFSYLAKNSKFSRSNSYFSILTPTFLRDGFLNSCFKNPSENSALEDRRRNFHLIMLFKIQHGLVDMVPGDVLRQSDQRT